MLNFMTTTRTDNSEIQYLNYFNNGTLLNHSTSNAPRAPYQIYRLHLLPGLVLKLAEQVETSLGVMD